MLQQCLYHSDWRLHPCMQMPLLDVAPVSHEGSLNQSKNSNNPSFAFLPSLIPAQSNHPAFAHSFLLFFSLPFLNFSGECCLILWLLAKLASGIHLRPTRRGLIPVPGKVAQCRHSDKQPGRVWHCHQLWQGHWSWEHQPPKWGKPRESTSSCCKREILTGRCEGKREKLF